MRQNDEIVAHIAQTIGQVAPAPEQLAELQHASEQSFRFVQPLRLNVLTLSALFVQDVLHDHPEIKRETMLRLAAAELTAAAAFIVRSIKRAAGEELCPARFALAAYETADLLLERPWRSEGDALEFTREYSVDIRRDAAEARLESIRAIIGQLPDDEAIHVECVAQTLRNILSAGRLAGFAFDLVEAERTHALVNLARPTSQQPKE